MKIFSKNYKGKTIYLEPEPIILPRRRPFPIGGEIQDKKEIESHPAMATATRPVQHLVADSAAFIRNEPLQNISEHVYTVQEVVSEIKHKPTLQRLQCLPYELQIRQPSEKSYSAVVEFAKKTGDFAVLSRTDLLVMALVYELTVEHEGADQIRTEPVSNQITTTGGAQNLFSNPRDIAGFHVSSKLRANPMSVGQQKSYNAVDKTEAQPKSENTEKPNEGSEENTPSDVEIVSEKPALDKQPDVSPGKGDDDDSAVGDSSSNEEEEEGEADVSLSEDDESEGDDDDWITTDNLAAAVAKMSTTEQQAVEPTPTTTHVAALTTDFAMQNVLLHMNLGLVSPSGFLIRRIKTYILRCRACFKTTPVMSKRFCSSCGYESLDRVTVSVDAQGKTVVHLSKRRMLNTKGMRHDLPLPKGGKHAFDPVIMEDQRVPHNRLSKKARAQLNPLDDDYVARDSPFLMRDVNSRSAKLGLHSHGQAERGDRNGFKSTKKRGGKRR